MTKYEKLIDFISAVTGNNLMVLTCASGRMKPFIYNIVHLCILFISLILACMLAFLESVYVTELFTVDDYKLLLNIFLISLLIINISIGLFITYKFNQRAIKSIRKTIKI